jgi:hypothetical protein
MNLPSSITSADSADPSHGLDDLDDFNGFQFAEAATPQLPPAEPSVPLVSAAARAEVAASTAAAEADARRTQAGQTLQQLIWHAPNGRRIHPRLTSGRWSLYQGLLPLLRGRPAPDPSLTPERLMETEHQAAYAERYITAALLLYIACNDWETWSQPRPSAPPLINDWQALLLDARRWGDEFIHPTQLDDAVQMAEVLSHLTFLALTKQRPSADVDDAVEDEPEKKTPHGIGKTGI